MDPHRPLGEKYAPFLAQGCPWALAYPSEAPSGAIAAVPTTMEASVNGPLYQHRRRAFGIALVLLTPYYLLDIAKSAGTATLVARTLWLCIIGAASVVGGRKSRLSDAAARLAGFASGIAGTVIVAGYGGSRSVYFGLLLGMPFCVLACVPDLLSCAVLAGISSTLGGVVLLAREGRGIAAMVEWSVLSAVLNGLAGWATIFYGRLTRAQIKTERERARIVEELRAAEEKFQAAFSSVGLGAVIVSLDGTILAANAAFLDILGAERLFGSSYFDLLVPDEVAESQAMRSCLAAGKPLPRVERRFVRADGEVFKASVHASPIHGRMGQVEAAVIMIEDITERTRLREQLAASEALFRDLAERAIVGVYVVQDGRFQYVNPRLAEIFGYSLEELSGGHITHVSLTHPDDRAKVEESIRRRLEGDQASADYELRGVKKDGEVIFVQVLAARTVYHDRPAIVGTMLDVTQRKRAELELMRMEKLESLGVLAGGIAHDFNNLLAVVLGDVSVAREHLTENPLADEALFEAEKAALRARELTAQLLTFSRGGEPVKRRLELSALLRSSATFALRGSAVRCQLDLPVNLWPVQADEGQIGQVIQNIVLNAVQAMPEGGEICVSARNEEGEGPARGPSGRCVRVSIRDNGPGIPAELAGKIFDPYFTTKPKGTGLGLATAHSIIVRHGGRIGVESTPGHGACFDLLLPAALEEGERVGQKSESSCTNGRGRVVVMDDEDMVRRSVMRMLSRLGFDSLGARDGAEVLALCENARKEGEPVDAAIMDLTIPGGMGGKEAVRLLHEREPYVKAIVSSGYSGDPVMAEYAKYGFSGVVVKPYRVQELGEVLQEVLGAAGAALVNQPTTPRA